MLSALSNCSGPSPLAPPPLTLEVRIGKEASHPRDNLRQDDTLPLINGRSINNEERPIQNLIAALPLLATDARGTANLWISTTKEGWVVSTKVLSSDLSPEAEQEVIERIRVTRFPLTKNNQGEAYTQFTLKVRITPSQ